MADLSALLAVALDADERAVYCCAAARGSTIGITNKRLIAVGGTFPPVAVPLRAIRRCFVRRIGLLAKRYVVVGVMTHGDVQPWVECSDKQQCMRIVSAIQAARLHGVRVG